MKIQVRVEYNTKPEVGRMEKTENLWSGIVAGLCPMLGGGGHCGIEL